MEPAKTLEATDSITEANGPSSPAPMTRDRANALARKHADTGGSDNSGTFVDALTTEAAANAIMEAGAAKDAEIDRLRGALKHTETVSADLMDAKEHMAFLRNGGWEVLQDPKYWEGVRNFNEAIGNAMREVRLAGFVDVPKAQDRKPAPFDFRAHLIRQREFSLRVFGPGARTKGVLDHIRKELNEIEADPTDVSEWIDVVILALDGAWRAGFSPVEIIAALVAKQQKNENRTWPDWRSAPPDQAIEHDRSKS